MKSLKENMKFLRYLYQMSKINIQIQLIFTLETELLVQQGSSAVISKRSETRKKKY